MQYFYKFIHIFNAISEPFQKLACKNKSFSWTNLCQSMFIELNCCMVSAPMLEVIYDGSAIFWWKYTLMLALKCLVPYFSRNAQLLNTFTPYCIIVRSLIMHNRITQIQIIKCWLLLKLSDIGDHTYMVGSLLCIQIITPWCTSLHNQIFPLANYPGLKILLIFFPSVVFNIPRDLLAFFWIQSLDALIFWPH